VGRTWNRGLLFQSEDNVEVIRGNGRQLSNAAYSKRSGIVVSRTVPQPLLAGHAAQLSRYSTLREDCRSRSPITSRTASVRWSLPGDGRDARSARPAVARYFE
jgi:hypothetical protein